MDAVVVKVGLGGVIYKHIALIAGWLVITSAVNVLGLEELEIGTERVGGLESTWFLPLLRTRAVKLFTFQDMEHQKEDC